MFGMNYLIWIGFWEETGEVVSPLLAETFLPRLIAPAYCPGLLIQDFFNPTIKNRVSNIFRWNSARLLSLNSSSARYYEAQFSGFL